jgi:succinate dehydrogenase hydrophobic anchor subunit
VLFLWHASSIVDFSRRTRTPWWERIIALVVALLTIHSVMSPTNPYGKYP